MKTIKTYLKLFIGIAVLVLFAVVFLSSNRATDLENSKMNHWQEAPLERRSAAVKILTGTEEGADLMVQCLDKIAILPDAKTMEVRDAAALCFIGIQLKEKI